MPSAIVISGVSSGHPDWAQRMQYFLEEQRWSLDQTISFRNGAYWAARYWWQANDRWRGRVFLARSPLATRLARENALDVFIRWNS